MRGGAETPASGVSRSTALNPYANRSGKGLPIFSEERSKEKKLKVRSNYPKIRSTVSVLF